jgi:hypothetical protein
MSFAVAVSSSAFSSALETGVPFGVGVVDMGRDSSILPDSAAPAAVVARSL